MNSQEFPTSMGRSSPKHDFPTTAAHSHNHHQQSSPPSLNGMNMNDFYQQQQGYPPSPGGMGPQQSAQQQDLTIDGIPNSSGGFSHRRSRASRTFKNPPQPHMCIKERTIDGKEVFINVLSWTRIANPDNPDAPIPLYGGMKVGKIPPGSPRAPPLVYAVMASPEVLKKAGRKCPDTPERMNLVDLMCEFVEAMNPSLHLSRKPEILKDRDLSGELKDVWSAVQACRDKGRVDSGPTEIVVYTEFGPETAPSYEQAQQQQRHQPQQPQSQHLHHQHGYMGETYQLHTSTVQQSAITNSTPPPTTSTTLTNTSNADVNNVDTITSEKPYSDVPDSGHNSNSSSSNDQSVDELLSRQTETSLKISPSSTLPVKSNGLTLPTNAVGSAPDNSSTTSPDSSNLVPQQAQPEKSSPTSPTNTTTTTATTVSPTAPATPQKEPKNSSHNFFPMFRSSKSSASSSSSSNNSGTADKSSSADKDKDSNSSDSTAPAPDTPVKTSSKKSGLNFFRRNKSDSKKQPEQPSTPTKVAQKDHPQKDPPQPPQPTVDSNKLNLLVDESLLHHHHHHHHHLVDGGSNGTAEIIENSATIVAK